MINPVSLIIGDIQTRLKRLEDNIGSMSDSLLNFMSVEEELGLIDSYYIYKRDMNDSFILGTGRIGITPMGDKRSPEELLASG